MTSLAEFAQTMPAPLPPPRIHVLAYDIERTGSTGPCKVIGIGASVVDEHFQEIDSLLAGCFKPREALFEWRCIEEFYLGPELKELEARRKGEPFVTKDFTPRQILPLLAAATPKEARTQEDAERMAIDSFVEFVLRAEARAKLNGAQFMICSDCTEFDTHRINDLLEKYRPDVSPLPYSMMTDKWATHYDVGEIQRGFLAIDKRNWIREGSGATVEIEKTWDVPPKTKEHNHMPDSDAYTIAFDMQALIAASEGRLQRRAVKL